MYHHLSYYIPKSAKGCVTSGELTTYVKHYGAPPYLTHQHSGTLALPLSLTTIIAKIFNFYANATSFRHKSPLSLED